MKTYRQFLTNVDPSYNRKLHQASMGWENMATMIDSGEEVRFDNPKVRPYFDFLMDNDYMTRQEIERIQRSIRKNARHGTKTLGINVLRVHGLAHPSKISVSLGAETHTKL